ncbi:hypothetical protein ACFL6K_02805 [Candidatus Latescibacterota bacterium]
MKQFILLISLIICAAPLYSQEPVQNEPIDSINLQSLFINKDEQGLRPYIHSAADSVLAILDENAEGVAEGRGERLLNYLRILSYAGDMSSKEALIKAMICPWVGGSTIARGLMRLGPQVKPEILSYLDRENWEHSSGTISTLNRMARIDTTGTYVTEEFREKVRDKLVVMLADRANNEANLTISAVRGLSYFGDESVIPLLEEISKEDIPELVYLERTPQEIIDYIKEKK